ncbi:DUF192 domain-containing protein [Blattabacterium sp. (Nauphoeta cinerea)]|uniref:DUF192 domain-containing protein n=1 Tax=Blattabacterium sp. (Nauphoeta cinerea) TaxID=1316444 RepID=UPI000418C00C|nr:DUF192 domain-containing protein [Blattabacterium sp. (Nauphoeta cinerea)]
MKKINIFYYLIMCFSINSSEKIYYDSDMFLDIGNSLEIEFIKDGELYFRNNNYIIKKIDIELAYSDTEKKNGLKYRSDLKENRGMLFLLKNKEEYEHINMKDVRIPLDIVYINQFNTVVFVNKYVTPMKNIEIINLSSPIKYVLEINAGMSDQWGIKEGITKITFK